MYSRNLDLYFDCVTSVNYQNNKKLFFKELSRDLKWDSKTPI